MNINLDSSSVFSRLPEVVQRNIQPIVFMVAAIVLGILTGFIFTQMKSLLSRAWAPVPPVKDDDDIRSPVLATRTPPPENDGPFFPPSIQTSQPDVTSVPPQKNTSAPTTLFHQTIVNVPPSDPFLQRSLPNYSFDDSVDDLVLEDPIYPSQPLDFDPEQNALPVFTENLPSLTSEDLILSKSVPKLPSAPQTVPLPATPAALTPQPAVQDTTSALPSTNDTITSDHLTTILRYYSYGGQDIINCNGENYFVENTPISWARHQVMIQKVSTRAAGSHEDKITILMNKRGKIIDVTLGNPMDVQDDDIPTKVIPPEWIPHFLALYCEIAKQHSNFITTCW